MPEVNKGVAAPMPAAESGAKLPATEIERRKIKFEALTKEDDDARSKRRAEELDALTQVHLDNVAKSHEMYPTPALPFTEMSEDDQHRWNEKRKDIDSANRAYHLAVKRTCGEHRDEDVHLARLRDAAKSAA